MSRLAELEKMLESNPDDPFLIYAMAREYEQRQATMQAILMYELLINDHTLYIPTYYHYAKLLFSAGNRNEAINLLHKGIEYGLKEKEMHAVSEMRAILSSWNSGEEDED